MKIYVVTTGAIFGVLTLAHIWRMVEEGSHVATDPFFCPRHSPLGRAQSLGVARVYES